MAKIEVERKRSGLGWLWALLALLVIALIAWWIWGAMSNDEAVDPGTEVGVVVPVDPAAPAVGVEQGTAAQAAMVDLAPILANPQTWVGQPFPGGEVRVAEVVTDRGFWITGTGGERLFGVILDQPAEQPVDINPQQTLRITGGTLRDASYIPQIEGAPLDDNTRAILEEQQIFLVVDEDGMEVAAGGEPQPGTDPAQGFGTEGQ